MEPVLVALENLIQGAGTLGNLEGVIRSSLASTPSDARAISDVVTNAFRSGRLPAADYQQLSRLLADHSGGSGDNPDRTRLRVRPVGVAAPSVQEPSDRTVVRPPRQKQVAAPSLPTAPPTSSAPRTEKLANPVPPPITVQTLSEAPGRAAGGDVWLEDVDIGAVLVGRYRLELRLGEGGMGVVYLAHDLVEQEFSDRPYVAVKVLRSTFREHPDSLKALHEEVQKSRSLAHPNIVGVYTFHRDDTGVFMTMEYLEGQTLADHLKGDFANGVPFEKALPIIEGICRALTYAHEKGVVHSDLKPSNVFLTQDGATKVLDFGIARAMGTGKGTAGYDAGKLEALTPSYASCEMLEGQPPDPRDDVYALGCVAYQILTGRHPYTMAPAVMARDAGMKLSPIAHLARRQNVAISSALDFRRGKRSATVQDFIRALRPPPPISLRRKIVYTTLAIAGVALLIAASWFSWQLKSADDESAFVESLLQRGATTDVRDPETAKVLLEQGNEYLEQARTDFDPALLTEGVSTAYGAFQAALLMDPGSREAAEGILEVLHLYRQEARRAFDEGRLKQSRELVDIGLRIHPGNRELQVLRAEIDEVAPPGAPPTSP